MTDYSDAIVAEYLRRLDVAAAGLPADRRAELLGEIGEHIAHARSSGEVADEAGLRELLDRLGDPDDIVAEARDGEPDPSRYGQPPAAEPLVHYRRPGIGLEIGAVVLMTLGSVIPVLGWLAGAVLLWASKRWTVGEKILATLIVPGGPFTLTLFATLYGGQVCSSSSSTDSAGNNVQNVTTCSGFALPPWLGVIAFIVILVGPFVVGGILLRRASNRAALEPGIPVYVTPAGAGAPGASRWGPLEIAAVLLLSIGGFVIPVVGPVAGLVCAWISTAWTTTEKWVATVIASLALLLPLLGLIAVAVART